ncbi:Ig-like domain-containing protein [Corynebacterium mendelii]|uniref:L,D-transpeptidase family protein n=1 Tax=Corynebacterium mendelii TaxID=2765362 RepID=A0A939E0E5_9CORY|nr:Ig-like domain-containing protein [Corynebacterium mendelii]MBN9644144.1 L,D-transpeptidase family protein [Corynebacterium mendelii]
MTFSAGLRRRLVALGIAAAATVTAVTGCSSTDAAQQTVAETAAETTTSAVSATTTSKPLPAVASVKDGTKNYNPTEPVTVKAVEGTFTDIQMTNQDGKVVESTLSEDKKTWTTAEVLGYYRTYTIKATTSNGATMTTVFSTIEPDSITDVALSPLDGSVVGVGQVLSFRFGQSIADRKAAQDAITITTEPHVDGAFYWLNDYLVRWRGEEFFQPGTKIDVNVDLYGKNLGGGVWGNRDNSASFTIGDKVVSVADSNSKTVTVYRNDEAIRTIPISMGMPEFPTPNGTYVVGDQYDELVMDSSTFGLPVDDPQGYRTKVQYATQMSWSGIYVHAAPWSVWAQGSQDVSHGCLNMSTANAKWFMDQAKRGDVVIVKNTNGGVLSGYDGLGDWNIPWEEWSKGNLYTGAGAASAPATSEITTSSATTATAASPTHTSTSSEPSPVGESATSSGTTTANRES